MNIKWFWIDINQNQITVKCSEFFTTKSKKERIIPSNQNLSKAFIDRILKIFNITIDDFVFNNSRGKKFNEDYVDKKFNNSIRADKLDERIHFHTLQYSFASLLVQRGVSL